MYFSFNAVVVAFSPAQLEAQREMPCDDVIKCYGVIISDVGGHPHNIAGPCVRVREEERWLAGGEKLDRNRIVAAADLVAT